MPGAIEAFDPLDVVVLGFPTLPAGNENAELLQKETPALAGVLDPSPWKVTSAATLEVISSSRTE